MVIVIIIRVVFIRVLWDIILEQLRIKLHLSGFFPLGQSFFYQSLVLSQLNHLEVFLSIELLFDKSVELFTNGVGSENSRELLHCQSSFELSFAKLLGVEDFESSFYEPCIRRKAQRYQGLGKLLQFDTTSSVIVDDFEKLFGELDV